LEKDNCFDKIKTMNTELDILKQLMQFVEKEPFSFFSINNDLDYDHTHNLNSPTLSIFGIKGSQIDLSFTKYNTGLYCKFLKDTIFGKDKKVICFNSKPFFSYILSNKVKASFFEASFYDLQWFFSYNGKRDVKISSRNDLIATFSEVVSLLSNDKNNLYKTIYGRLIAEVLPYIENNYLIDFEEEVKVYPFYKIEGQENGRLSCQMNHRKSYNPHSLGPEIKGNLRPVFPHNVFMIFDYKNMEVSVLAEICKDKNLIKILESGKDFYEEVYKIVIGGENKNSRSIAKKIFLPIIYGQAHLSLSDQLSVSESTAKELINRLRKVFPDAFEFSDNAQDEARNNGYVKDLFSRTRIFNDNFHKARNFVIQSPAALLCLEKLINLYDGLNKKEARIVFSIHDGYGISVAKDNFFSLYAGIKAILESDSILLPSLKLHTSLKIGKNLNEMLDFKRKDVV
jgi:DNA polymerase family A